MKTSFALAALAAFASGAIATPAGCSASYSGSFEITVVSSSASKRDLAQKRAACGSSGVLTLTLNNGQLTDSAGRIGYIASNYQFQFDNPPQGNALLVGGYSACSNGSLALGESAVFYECLSGTFYNLYDADWAPQCSPILLYMMPCGTVGQQSDGQPTGTTVLPQVSQISDGQPQAVTAVPVPVSQIGDGQPQVVTQLSAVPITQISDGQVQAPTASPVTQISDGQVQAPTVTGAPVSQISDGQVQATATATATASAVTVAPVSGTASISVLPNTNTTLAISASPTPTASPLSANSASGMTFASTFAAIVVGFTAILLL